MIPWQERTMEWEQLRTYAKQFSHFESIIDWLYAIGVLPNDVTYMPDEDIKTSLNPGAIKCGYLAATAFAWDRDGPSSPDEFLDALEFELAGSEKKEVAAEALRELGHLAEGEQESPLGVTLIDSEERDQFRRQESAEDAWDTYGLS